MKEYEFVFSSTAVRSLESKLLTKDQLNRMAEAKDFSSALRVLQETSYSDSLSKAGQDKSYEEALDYELHNLYESMEEMSPYKEIVDIALLKYDLHNLKLIFKDHVMGTDNSSLMINLGQAKIQEISQAAKEGKRKEIDSMLGGLATDAVYGYSDSLDTQTIDLAVDKGFYRKLKDLADESGVKMLEDYARDYIDFSNLIALFRMKNQDRDLSYVENVLVDGGNISKEDLEGSFHESIQAIVQRYRNERIGKRLSKALEEYENSGSISSFEKEFDNHMMDLAKSASHITFGPEVLFAYMISKEIEIKNIRIILVSKTNGLGEDKIKERLRDTYV